MSSSHDEQPLTRRQLRELERQKPRKEREADAKAAEEAEAARKAQAEREAAEAAAAGVVAGDGAPSRREVRNQPAAETTPEPVSAVPADAAAPADAAGAADAEIVEDTIIPEIVHSEDDLQDDSEPETLAQPIIDVVPMSESVIVPSSENDTQFADEGDDDEAQHAEIITETTDTGETVIEQMVIDVPIADTVDPTAEAAAHAEAEERKAAASEPTLAPMFQSPADRTPVSSEELPSSFDDLISLRNTAATNSISTTSALVLPNVPGSGDVGTALDETGEVIITGSIDLPASFGATGAPASGLESNDLDTLLERSEGETGASDVAPVSASRAISTNTSSTSLIAPPKRARANAPVVLAITAGVLAVGVVSLLLAVFVFRVF
ncbi:hypothetical protein [Herbiconiux ginsengi]|uniref:Uncharacterized protein n=1 Tax=Herbiconiux ginsengi TaxID=381665 RepID=A0A1H3QDG4_9MICO|nr:hypothetical protein [Herbiconiux ginsengi]SDZ11604.1 hypothetical protein SAMN05216554_2472 [Herbiconiux ginsengi]